MEGNDRSRVSRKVPGTEERQLIEETVNCSKRRTPMTSRTLTLASTLLLLVGTIPGGGSILRAAGEGVVASPQAALGPGPNWTDDGPIHGVKSSYTPLVITGPNQIRVYSNSNGKGNGDGRWYMASGTFSRVGAFTQVLSPSQIFDIPVLPGCAYNSPFVRTNAAVRGPSGRYYALLHIRDCYTPTNTGDIPTWLTSDDGVSWTYHGRLIIDGGYPGVGGNSNDLIVQEDKPALLDPVNPGNNRFLYYDTIYTSYGLAKMALLFSADGMNWFQYKDSTGQVADLWPSDPQVSSYTPGFIAATNTPNGFHVISPDTYPATKNLHIFSCDGVHFRVLDPNSKTQNGPKGTNLVYEGATGLVHALSTGEHYSMMEQLWSCN